MATRYDGLKTKTTSIQNSETMKEILDNRGVTQITHYNTKILKTLTAQQISTLTVDTHYWSSEDRYWKLAAKYYGDPKYWWIIAWFNKKPTEQHIQLGETILVPLYLDEVLTAFGL